MRHVQILLPEALSDFVETNVASGQYASASDVIGDALRLLEAQQSDAAKLEWLQEAVRVGLESGDAGEVDIEDVIAEAKARRAAPGR
ncbi:type II toxin-antitoxin system ParD family antitoxin [Tardiphaga sp.]|uniref:type II toxin-antitoxin system ParD family antitoxin n=1 Tax=Tardiphaga sp. TaxID=1926292 RepID=UPI0025F477D0|nr:type II toxin-antitoxin system ParD family antitoxin [Tardiphaga sp.]